MVSAQKILNSLLPPYVKRIVDPVTDGIDTFVKSSIPALAAGNIVLDAGAGECRFKKIVEENHRYIAVDASWGDSTWDYSEIDAVSHVEKLPFRADIFNAVLCTQVLEHVREPQDVLNELYRVLKPNGTIILSAPQGWGVHQPPHDYFRFTNYGLLHLLKKAGFVDISIKPSCGYFGYIANRLTVMPKILFWQIENKYIRLALMPFEILSYFFCVLLFPLILNAIDFLDRKRNYTLNYFATAKKIKNHE